MKGPTGLPHRQFPAPVCAIHPGAGDHVPPYLIEESGAWGLQGSAPWVLVLHLAFRFPLMRLWSRSEVNLSAPQFLFCTVKSVLRIGNLCGALALCQTAPFALCELSCLFVWKSSLFCSKPTWQLKWWCQGSASGNPHKQGDDKKHLCFAGRRVSARVSRAWHRKGNWDTVNH